MRPRYLFLHLRPIAHGQRHGTDLLEGLLPRTATRLFEEMLHNRLPEESAQRFPLRLGKRQELLVLLVIEENLYFMG